MGPSAVEASACLCLKRCEEAWGFSPLVKGFFSLWKDLGSTFPS